jgi:hypothetical protein
MAAQAKRVGKMGDWLSKNAFKFLLASENFDPCLVFVEMSQVGMGVCVRADDVSMVNNGE